ncbi:DUF1365 domain-containing protein [Ponticoccus sp. SC2-23]|uniref:DUF1365 domain-containing protein n=1 Tax=Alexandriicola marinus TaxID=2081710 RepID=UPI000FD9F231|nr:DUF1365 domain-containing protein [Alexandriicola marinus]MBM1220469.1 DUF1365 domain-containing protein [Ponticoccus sp. SC6-9]MBM1225155.1 DUF1365 domain-containing protein [Ponticoccus sp. SC6-15]MBM1228669.1 DUF1365 domain-containing protein [Ponticoccus sp. SC6-38]MBM1233694.1 DUF1365 domain-containing protein [Ponticoccus sp. SC6-45]MBM1239170.1 DUF1365 domain-containing protein [Ponticoccus sp. SC6-49]MBM1242952.1 DUF1365 domain-containing protein [Ponticoccus sp. SC2-64]MBM1247218
MNQIEHIAGETYHGRRGGTKNAFRYSIDYVLLDAEAAVSTPAMFGRDSAGFMSLWDTDHGGPPGEGRGPLWVRDVLEAHQIEQPARIELLAQPRVMGHVFNPVSFWLCRDDAGVLRTVIAEVTNTYGDRHSYICRHDDGREITANETLRATKIFYVSPFQPIEGGYTFRFGIEPSRINIHIDYTQGNGGLIATLVGNRKPLTTVSMLRAGLRRPFGSRRVLALIHWQALKLWWKGAIFRRRPEPPNAEVSR